jgi:hypothetical protein
VDYCAPNPNTKRFKNRLVIAWQATPKMI